MIRPSIKSYHENVRKHWITPISERPYFLGKSAFDIRWQEDRPPVNIKRNGTLFEMEIAIPGFSKSELEVSVDEDILTIRGEKKTEDSYSDEDYVLKEFDVKVVERRFHLAKGIGHEKISAEYENGILKLSFTDVPKEEEASRQTIEVH